MSAYIDVRLGDSGKYVSKSVYQYDHGRKLRLHGQDTSLSTVVQYSFSGMLEVLSVAGEFDGDMFVCPVPDVMQMQDRDIVAYLYAEEDVSGKTTHEIRIPVIARPRPSELYTPEQIDNYNSAMLELTGAIEQVEDIKEDVDGIVERATEAVSTAETWASASATATLLDPEEDPSVIVSIDENGNRVISFGIPAGKTGEPGGVGPTGNDGISPTLTISEIDEGHRITIVDVNGEQSFDVMDGKDGESGGVAESIEWENITNKPFSYPPDTHTHSLEDLNAASIDHEHNAEDVGARPSDWVPTISDIEGLQEAIDNGGNVKSVNGVEADDAGNILLDASHVKSRPDTWTPSADDVGAVYVERGGTEEPGLPAQNDADTLGGIPAAKYALKTDIPEIPEPIDPTVYWENIQNKPEAFAPDEHNHDWESIQNKPNTLVNIIVEEWEFTLEDGSVVTKKVLTNA